MAAALGLGVGEGDVVVSLGTSGTAFALSREPSHDPSGTVAGFADATGKFLPLVCTLNAARVLGAAMTITGRSIEELDDLALSVTDSAGLVLLPFLDGERTPALPDATGVVHGLTRRNATPAHLIRASVEGMLAGLADAVDALPAPPTASRRVVLIGGAARSRAVQQIAAELFGGEIWIPNPGEYVAQGAARQAAWMLSGSDQPPVWPVHGTSVEATEEQILAGRTTLSRHREVLGRAEPLLRSAAAGPRGSEQTP